MHSTAGSLQPPCLMMHGSAGRPWPKQWILQTQLQQRQQFVSLASFGHSPISRCASKQCSPTRDTGSAAIAAAAAATGSNNGSASQRPLRPLAMQLRSASSKPRRQQQRGFRRRRRHDTQVCAAAAVLQPPVAGETLTQLAARFMGYGVLVGSCFRSTPQIARIIKAGSARGVSLTASIAELIAYSITCAYNMRLGYAFSTYGEVAACWVQDIVLVGLIARHMRTGHKRLAAATAAFAVYCWWLVSGLCSVETLMVLQASTISMVALGGRMPQIVLNIKRGDSGELSITTSALNLAGNLARAFTTVVLTRDPLLLLANAVQACLNSVLLYQTAMTAARRRRRRLLMGETSDLDEVGDDEEDPHSGLSPSAIEAAEDEAEDDNDGTASATAASAAMAEAADGALGDGGFGSAGGSAMLMEPPPGEFMDLAGGAGGGGSGSGTSDY